ncbi:MAG: septum formation initiator family protein [Myxococcales bacterium]|nr:septum formation initiator family protein [Myxococcales bacterium]
MKRAWLQRITLAALLGSAIAFLPQQLDHGARSPNLERVRDEQAQLERENAALRDDIAHLRSEIAALKHDPRELERIAREDLNLVHPAEVVFEVKPPRTQTR